jgi:uncharacterized OB-fold protein
MRKCKGCGQIFDAPTPNDDYCIACLKEQEDRELCEFADPLIDPLNSGVNDF